VLCRFLANGLPLPHNTLTLLRAGAFYCIAALAIEASA